MAHPRVAARILQQAPRRPWPAEVLPRQPRESEAAAYGGFHGRSEERLSVLGKRFPGASSEQIAAAPNAIVGLGDEWETIRDPAHPSLKNEMKEGTHLQPSECVDECRP